MEEKMIEEINEGVVDTVYNEVSDSNGGLVAAGTVAVIVAIVGVGLYLYNRKKKNNYCEFKAMDVINGAKLNNDDEEFEETAE